MADNANKALVHRLVDEVMNTHDLDAIADLFTPAAASRAHQAFGEFLEAFPDWHEEVVLLVGEGDRVAGRFKCTGTQLGGFMGREPTGRHMRVDEVFFFEFEDGRISDMWGLEDTWNRLRQLGQIQSED